MNYNFSNLNRYSLILLLIAGMFLFGCSEDSCEKVNEPKSGDIHEATIEVNGVVKEYVKDELVNYGFEDSPVLFPTVMEHRVDGAPVENTTSYVNGFRSLKKEDILFLIRRFAEFTGVNLNPGGNLQASNDQTRQFASRLKQFEFTNNVDLGVLMEISKLTSMNVFSAIDNQIANTRNAGGYDLNSSLLRWERELIEGNAAAELTLEPQTKAVATGIAIVAVAMTVINKLVGIICRLIENTMPKVELNTSYVAILDDRDSSGMNYPTGRHFNKSDTFTVEHKFGGIVYARAAFQIRVDYMGLHDTYNDCYWIPNTTFLVSNLKCVGGQHVIGTADFGTSNLKKVRSTVDPSREAVLVPSNVSIEYGDCCCYRYRCTLNYNLLGDKGYQQVSWSNKKGK